MNKKNTTQWFHIAMIVVSIGIAIVAIWGIKKIIINNSSSTSTTLVKIENNWPVYTDINVLKQNNISNYNNNESLVSGTVVSVGPTQIKIITSEGNTQNFILALITKDTVIKERFLLPTQSPSAAASSIKSGSQIFYLGEKSTTSDNIHAGDGVDIKFSSGTTQLTAELINVMPSQLMTKIGSVQ